ncbi:MAG: V-type ATP synthase subunit F [Firmicutes bacterium]|nr:V-type ATP synthase subunit F [Bacillota bacterium]
MYKRVGVIGNAFSAALFKAAGLEVFAAADGSAAREALLKLEKEGFAVVFITEDYAQANQDILLRLKTKSFPAVIPIPSANGAGSGFGQAGVKQDIEKALGSDILL